MDKYLKIGLICMIGAVVLSPLSLLFRQLGTNSVFIILILAMLLELIGLIFVIISIIKKRRLK